jgi:hypothetical protein
METVESTELTGHRTCLMVPLPAIDSLDFVCLIRFFQYHWKQNRIMCDRTYHLKECIVIVEVKVVSLRPQHMLEMPGVQCVAYVEISQGCHFHLDNDNAFLQVLQHKIRLYFQYY